MYSLKYFTSLISVAVCHMNYIVLEMDVILLMRMGLHSH